MSSPRHNLPLLSAVLLGIAPLCAFAFDPPTRGDRIPESQPVAQSSPRPDKLADLACTVCDFTPTLDLLLKSPANLHAGFNAVTATELDVPEMSSVSSSLSANRFAALATLQFRDNEPLINRLKRAQAWPLLTFWDSSVATLYLGLDKRGEPGLHLRQKPSDRGSVMPRSRFVLIASPTVPSEGVTSEVPPSPR